MLFADHEVADQSPEIPKGHEARLGLLFRDTLKARFGRDASQVASLNRFKAFAILSVSGNLSPSSMELQKLLINCMTILAKERSLHSVFGAVEMQVDSQNAPNSEEM